MAAVKLDRALKIIDAALALGRQQNFKPLTVAVLDAGGHVTALMREDGSGNLRPDMAIAKAWGALGLGSGSRALLRRAEEQPAFVSALATVSQGRLLPVPGGVLIRERSGDVIGAVGISGDTSDNDEACAIHGIEAVGLTADPG
jgi:uncharacterized protein GlcG (DUF336 family)